MREEGPDLQLLLQHGMDCSLPSGGPAGIAGCVTANNFAYNGRLCGPVQARGVCHPGLFKKKWIQRVEMHSTHRQVVRLLQTILQT